MKRQAENFSLADCKPIVIPAHAGIQASGDTDAETNTSVIPANAGIQCVGLIAFENNQMDELDSRMRGNDRIIFVVGHLP